jgi:hypothetical protein
MTGPEFEVMATPRRGPGGSDLDEAATDFDDPSGGKTG